MTWTLHYTKQAQKDAKKLASSGLKAKAQALLAILEQDPWQNPPPFEKLVGDLSGAYSQLEDCMKIVYSYYVMDLLHTGHLLMLKNSKAIAGPDGRLVVGIVSDEAIEQQKGRPPLLSFRERLELAQSIRYVDSVVQQVQLPC